MVLDISSIAAFGEVAGEAVNSGIEMLAALWTAFMEQIGLDGFDGFDFDIGRVFVEIFNHLNPINALDISLDAPAPEVS